MTSPPTSAATWPDDVVERVSRAIKAAWKAHPAWQDRDPAVARAALDAIACEVRAGMAERDHFREALERIEGLDDPDLSASDLAQHDRHAGCATGYRDAANLARAALSATPAPDDAPGLERATLDGWHDTATAPENVAVLVHIPQAEHYGPGIYRAMLVNMGTGRRWHSMGLHIGRDIPDDYTPTRWRLLPVVPCALASRGGA